MQHIRSTYSREKEIQACNMFNHHNALQEHFAKIPIVIRPGWVNKFCRKKVTKYSCSALAQQQKRKRGEKKCQCYKKTSEQALHPPFTTESSCCGQSHSLCNKYGVIVLLSATLFSKTLSSLEDFDTLILFQGGIGSIFTEWDAIPRALEPWTG